MNQMCSIKSSPHPVNLETRILVYEHFSRITKQVVAQLLPARCMLCRQPAITGQHICSRCHDDLPLNHTHCQGCARPLHTGDDLLCGDCQQHRPSYDHIHAPLLYKDSVRELVIGLKFTEHLRNARLLADLFHQHTAGLGSPEHIIPVPLHPKRLQERGYNQSQELARFLGKTSNIPVTHNACRRNRHTERQSDLKQNERRRNVRNAFQINPQFRARHVAIVDDVMTSGHTVNELARALKLTGVERIDVWIMARAGKGTE